MSATSSLRFHRPGEAVKFQDGTAVLEGICNGEPFEGEPGIMTHLPVHVRDGNRNIMVAVKNIIEWHGA